MPHKKQTEQLPNNLQVIQFAPGEIHPLVVAAKDIGKIILGYSSKTASNERSRKVGPRYFMVGSRPYYLVSDLIDYFTKNPVETTG